jgi:hypothetical protein
MLSGVSNAVDHDIATQVEEVTKVLGGVAVGLDELDSRLAKLRWEAAAARPLDVTSQPAAASLTATAAPTRPLPPSTIAFATPAA